MSDSRDTARRHARTDMLIRAIIAALLLVVAADLLAADYLGGHAAQPRPATPPTVVVRP